MPTYEYRCRGCGEDLEAVQSFDDPPLTECPSCGGSLRKKFAAPGIAFKGSGFYKTDNASSKAPKEPAAASASSTSSDASSNGSGSKTSSGGSNGSGDAKGSSDKAGSTSSPKATTAS